MPHKQIKRSPGRPKKALSPSSEKPNLTDKQWRGLNRELRGYRGQLQGVGWPSKTPAKTVALAAGASVRSVYAWRRDPSYLFGLHWLLGAKIAEQMEHNDPQQSESPLTEKQRAASIHTFVKKNWIGAVQSPIDGKVYLSIDDYVTHLLAHDDVAPWTDELVKKKSE